MQTFLPFADYERSAAALDYRRLGAQINEVQTIAGHHLEINTGPHGNHPITQAWSGFTAQLITFGLVCETEWESRGYKVRQNKAKLEWMLTCAAEDDVMERPPWFGDPRVHEQYQRLLLLKNPTFYGPKFPGVEPLADSRDFVYPQHFDRA